MKKVSPLYTLVLLYRFLIFLPILPLQAVVFEGMAPERAVYLYRGQIALGILTLIICMLIRRHTLYRQKKGEWTQTGGMLLKYRESCDFHHFDSLCISENLLQRLLKFCRIQGVTARHRSTLYLSSSQGRALTEDFLSAECPPCPCYRGTFLGCVLLSAGFSSVLTTLAALVPSLRSLAKALGEKQTAALMSELRPQDILGFLGLPPAIRLFSSVLITVWGIGFVSGFFRYCSPRLGTDGTLTSLRFGLLTRHTYIFRNDRISVLTISQSIALTLMKRCVVKVHIPSTGSHEGIILSDACTRPCANSILSHISLRLCGEKPRITAIPPDAALWGYTYLPMTALSSLCLLCIWSDRFNIYNLPPYLSGFFIALCSVWFFFRVTAHRRSFLSECQNALIINSFKGLTFTESYIPKDKIRTVKISQSIFQKRRGLCSLRIYVRSTKKQSFKIRHIEKEKAAQLLKK